MRGLIVASLGLIMAASVAYGSPVGSCSTFSGKGAVTYLRDDNNCSVFYECVSHKPTKVVCPNGLHFNAVLKVCDLPSASGCAVATTPSPVKTTVFTHATDSPSNAPPLKAKQMAVTTTVFTHEPSSTEAWLDVVPVQTVKPSQCPSVGGCPKYTGDDSLVIQLPHAFNCSLFCMCAHGQAVTFECPRGLHYNKVEGYCDWPANAQCVPDKGFAATWVSTEAPVPIAKEPTRRRRSWSLRFN